MKSKILALAVALVMVLAFTACGSSSDSSSEEAESKEGTVEIVDSGYYISDGYAYCGIKIENTDSEKTFEFAKVVATAYDENEDVLATEETYVNQIQPGDEQAAEIFMDLNGGTASKIEFSIDMGEAYDDGDATSIPSSKFEAEDINERTDEYGDVTFTGTVKNNSEKDCEDADVVILLTKDDKIVYGEETYLSNIKSGGSVPLDFELMATKLPDYDAYEIITVDATIY